MSRHKPAWIHSAWYDSLFILAPPFLCLLIIAMFPGFFQPDGAENEWVWFALVLCVDVGHVYSTIYRTYFDKEIISRNKTFFYLSPLLIYIVGVVMHSISPLLFWRAMAYLAVFHFVRQQYGFMRLYTRNEEKGISTRIDALMIYASTLYPLLYWHFSGKQLFNWFVEGDFVYFNSPAIIPFFTVIYLAIVVIYIGKELRMFYLAKNLNVPKNMLIAGTALSWYFGIVYFKGDLTFTLLNVVSHGIPYYALVWAHGRKKSSAAAPQSFQWLRKVFQPRNVVIYIGILLLLAYAEEMIWDGFIWKEHFSIFPTSASLPDITGDKMLMSLCIPLFALPQLLHYFIDGFIWKIRKDNFNWFVFFK